MRIISFVLALLVGLAAWGLVLAVSGGVAPLGKVGQAESLVFFTPIALFALPLAILAFVRGYTLAATWLFAMAPLLGFANFALSVTAALRTGHAAADGVGPPRTFAVLWCVMLAVVVVLLVIGRRLAPAARGASPR